MRKNIFKTLAIAFFIAFSFGKIKAGDDCTVMRTIPYLQMPTQNSMVVRWVTSLDCQGVVEYGTDSAKVAKGTATKVNGAATKTLIHRIKLNNLTPGTKYYYRVCSKFPPCNSQSTGSQHYSDVYSFTTLKDSNTNFTMLIFNDLHPYYFREALDAFIPKISPIIDTMKYDLLVFNGDCFDNFAKEEDIIHWLGIFSKFTKNNYIPSIYVAGNHEYDGAAASLLKNYIEFVHDGISYGTMSLGDTQLLFLDTGFSGKNEVNYKYFNNGDTLNYAYFKEYRGKQKAYIKNLVEKSVFKNAAKRVLIHHIPFYGKLIDEVNPNDKDQNLGGRINPYFEIGGEILNNAHIDISINAHIHYRQCIKEAGPYTQIGYPVYVCDGPDRCETDKYYQCYLPDNNSLVMTVLTKKNNNLFLKSYTLMYDADGKISEIEEIQVSNDDLELNKK
ncbi:MAG: fibronectin type III domain-containing protein [Dysgonamonadaceae bacterium]|jgi:hypothetical protein|nr:fibronectin type III domain-containing protein [Dysgonamonadaceae bacterium]